MVEGHASQILQYRPPLKGGHSESVHPRFIDVWNQRDFVFCRRSFFAEISKGIRGGLGVEICSKERIDHVVDLSYSQFQIQFLDRFFGKSATVG